MLTGTIIGTRSTGGGKNAAIGAAAGAGPGTGLSIRGRQCSVPDRCSTSASIRSRDRCG